jgi:hypothetical protein
MTSNKEFISQTKENLTKTGSTVILYAQIPDKKNSVTLNNPTDVWKKSITLKH